MDPQSIIQIGQGAIEAIFLVSFPLLGVAIVIGTVISLFQTVTQIQEQTLTFVPKFIAILLTLLFTANWMIKILVVYTTHLLENIPNFVR
ncbi:flagellar biosynthesis protein FliQ [Thermodesulfobacteriota bacterium]